MLCCLTSSAAGCTDFEASVANRMLGPAVMGFLNDLLATEMAKTWGDCKKATQTELQKCLDASAFPVEKTGTDYDLQVPYITHLDTAKLTSLSLRCDKDPASSSPKKYFFADIGASLDELAVALSVTLTMPPVTIDAPCTSGEKCFFDEHKLGVNIAGRVLCRDATSLGLELEGDDGITFDHPIQVTVSDHLPAIDITKAVKSGVQETVASATLPCTGSLESVCKVMCREVDSLMSLIV